MNIQINRQALIEKLNHVTKALPIKTTLPILTGIKFVADNDGLFLTGSDSDVTIKTHLPLRTENEELVKIITPGGIVIPGKYFFEIIKKLETDTIEINTFDGNEVLIRGDKGEYTLKGLPAENYPQNELSGVLHQFNLPTTKLKTAILQTIFAVAVNESRPTLTGVNFKFHNNELHCSATDSFRLSKRTLILEDEKEFDITIPGRSLSELGKTLDINDPVTEVAVTNNQILFKNGQISFQSRLLEGTYPDIASFIPVDFEIKITIDYRELFNAVDRVSLMAKEDRANVAKMTVLPDEKKLVIKSNSSEIGKIEEIIDIKEAEGSKLGIACSSLFLLDSLKAFQGANTDVMLGFNGDMKPFVVLDKTDEANLQLIVPVKLDE